MDLPEPIELTDDERRLLEQIAFEPYGPGGPDPEALRSSLDPASQLMGSLLARRAIPPVRWRYFTDPDLNIGRGHRSRMETLELNGGRLPVYRNPGFIKHLHYLVYGPNVPATSARAMGELIESCHSITSGDTQAFCSLARVEVRRHGLQHDHRTAAREFHKLALELGLDDWTARDVYDAVIRMR